MTAPLITVSDLTMGWDEEILLERPAFSWVSELETTPDYREHRTFVTPPIGRNGFYLIVASPDETFSPDETLLQATWLNLSDLVLLARRESTPPEDWRCSG